MLLAVCVLAALIIVSQSGGGSSAEVSGISTVKQQLEGISQHDTVLGDRNAKATIVEFGDLQCPVCQRFSTRVAPRLIAGVVRKGIANYELRQYTIIGPQSIDAARAAYAAGEQGRYWNFVALFYLNQGAENSGYVTDDFLTAIAKGAGVAQIAKWNADRHSSKWDPVLAGTQTEARQRGLRGTPSFLVKGRRRTETYRGVTVPSLSEIEAAIEAVR